MTSEQDLDSAMRQVFTGNFLDASDILNMPGSRVSLVIDSVSPPSREKDAAGKNIDKAILSFVKCKKRLILNNTNAKIIKMSHGDKASAWAGKPVTLCVRYLKKAFGQVNVPVIRIEPPEGVVTTFGMRKNMGIDRPYTADELAR
jgi:hypothetical protein